MKNLSLLVILLLFILSSTGWAPAQEKAKEEKPAESAKPEAVKKEAPPPPMKYRMGGIITAIDASAMKITLHQSSVKREKAVTLILGKEASEKLPGMKVGDAVNVWVMGKTVTHMEKVREGFFFRK
jgi:Cu/Ag efflux protein CusF